LCDSGPVPDAVSTRRVTAALAPFLVRSPAYLGLADGLRAQISDGRIPQGSRLPSERELTASLPVSRTTVTRAYDLLREQDYLESRRGSGSVARLPVTRAGRVDHLLVPRAGAEDSIDLTIAAPSTPPGVHAAYQAAVERLPAYLSGTGYYPTGVPALREAIARRYDARGLPTTPEQVVVVGGALPGLAIAAQAWVRPGDRVLVETPTYPNPIRSLRARGARLVGTPVDPEQGWDVEGAAATMAARRPVLAYLIPDFHNPTGALMGDADRARLGEAMDAHAVLPVVDESLVDDALDLEPGQLPAPFASYSARTVTLGSAGKSFWTGLRVGWMRLPPDRVTAAVAARLSVDLSTPLVDQLALLELMRVEATVRRHHRAALVESRTALLAALAEHLPDWTTVPGPGGKTLWCRLPRPASSALSVTAERHGVLVAAGPSFAPLGGFEQHVRLPHTLPPPVLTEAVRRLARAWADTPEERWTRPGRAPVVA
jgi:DNA-binding transcriptional MocR family regulator